MAANKKNNRLRIIAGLWRGRSLAFPNVGGLRPTPDRIRETLFNWLAPVITGARCLDLFAGSGALGFEAASRGSTEVVMVERERDAVQTLRAHAEQLQATGVQALQADAVEYLRGGAHIFDIVFLDPPFGDGVMQSCIDALATNGWVQSGSYVYLETARGVAPDLPPGWDLFRSKVAGQVAYHLVLVS